VASWYAWLIEKAFLPADLFLSYPIAVGELAIGIALFVGVFTALSAFFGALMNLHFMLAGALGAGENPIMFGLSLGIIFVGSAAYVYGVDRFLIPAVRRRLRAHRAHRHLPDRRPTPMAY
jgi:thiosulfate dehydrogenase [quinone] large subunit